MFEFKLVFIFICLFGIVLSVNFVDIFVIFLVLLVIIINWIIIIIKNIIILII